MSDLLFSLGNRLIPKKRRAKTQRLADLAGMKQEPQSLYGTMAVVSLILALALTVAYYFVMPIPEGLLAIPLLLIIFLVMAAILVFASARFSTFVIDSKVYTKMNEMEERLPEYLNELSLNLKAGDDLQTGMRRAAENDFGKLSEEMLEITTRTELGFDLTKSLQEFADDYPSSTIQDAFDLIIISWRKGANTPKLIDRIVSNMKVSHMMREKISASVSNYKIFIATVTVVIAPALMALAFYVINLIRSITTEVVSVTSTSTLPISINTIRFNDVHFVWFSALTLVVISTFASLIITYVQEGSIKGSTKQLLLYLLGSLGFYFVFMIVFSGFFELFAF